MKRFQNNTTSYVISLAIEQVEGMLNPSSKLMRHIFRKDDFKYGSGTGEQVAVALMLMRKNPINVNTYRPWNPFTKALGFSDDFGIHINNRASFSPADLTGLILHEYAHQCGFNHGYGRFANYKTQDKILYSVPYYLSENVTRWI